MGFDAPTVVLRLVKKCRLKACRSLEWVCLTSWWGRKAACALACAIQGLCCDRAYVHVRMKDRNEAKPRENQRTAGVEVVMLVDDGTSVLDDAIWRS